MCDPVTLTIAATAVAATGKIVGGINQNAQSKYQAKVASANAELDRRAAQDAMDRGAQEERRQYMKTSQMLGAQRAALSANGIEADFGSAADIQGDTKYIGAMDAQTIRENTMRETQGFEISAFNNDNKATAARSAGKAALIGSLFDAGSTILSGASQTSRMSANRAGATS